MAMAPSIAVSAVAFLLMRTEPVIVWLQRFRWTIRERRKMAAIGFAGYCHL